MRDLSPPSTLLQELAAFPQTVAAVLLKPAIDWHWTPAAMEWNLTQVVCHLRDVELEVHQPRFEAVMSQQDAFLQGYDADTWAGPRLYHQQDGPEALSTYLVARSATLASLMNVSDAQWHRTAQHAFFGTTTMHELLGLVVRHDEVHLRQILALAEQQER